MKVTERVNETHMEYGQYYGNLQANGLAKWYIESFAKFVSYHMVHKDFSASIAKIYPRIFPSSCYHF